MAQPSSAVDVLEARPFAKTRVTSGEAKMDAWLLGSVLALVSLSVVEVYSSSAVYAHQKFGSSTHFLWRHLFFIGLGAVALVLATRADLDRWRRRWPVLLVGTFVLLAATLFIGVSINNARRWLMVGPVSLQPAELAKISLLVYLADSLANKKEKVRMFTVGFVPHLVVCALFVGVVLKQPDLDAALILGAMTLTLLFVAGTKISYIVIAVLAAAPGVYWAVVGTPWRLQRLFAYLDPWQYRRGAGYQITESLIAIGSGGATGLGLGDGKQKLFYMPEAHSDFVMSNIGEELGFVGFAMVLLLFGVILWRGMVIAVRARSHFATYVAFGLTFSIAMQAALNIAVVLGAIPVTGLTLPFLSYGGSSMVVSLFSVGVLLNISTQRPVEAKSETRVRNAAVTNKRKKPRVRVVVA